MRVSSLCAVAVLVAATASTAIAASFDCAKARSDSEKLICGDAVLSGLDDDLAILFRKARAAAPNKGNFDTDAKLQWKWREANCHDRECLLNWYASRRSALSSLVASRPPSASPSGSVPAPANSSPDTKKSPCDHMGEFAEVIANMRDRGESEKAASRMAAAFFTDDKLLYDAVNVIHKIYTEPFLIAMDGPRIREAYRSVCNQKIGS